MRARRGPVLFLCCAVLGTLGPLVLPRASPKEIVRRTLQGPTRTVHERISPIAPRPVAPTPLCLRLRVPPVPCQPLR